MFSWPSLEMLFTPQQRYQRRNINAHTILSTALVVSVVMLTIWTSWRRGPWLDEFWTLWLSKHDLPLFNAITNRWLIDVHPPLFAFLNWIIQPVIGDSILLRRLVNLVPLALLFCLFFYLYGLYGKIRRFAVIFMILVITSPVFAYNITEIRSYFTQICFFSSLILCLYAICLLDTGDSIRKNFGLALCTVILIVLSLNLHYVTAVTTASVVGAVGLCKLAQRRNNWFYFLAITGVLASVPLVAWFLAQTTFLDKTSDTFWISVSFPAALRTLFGQVLKSFGFNIIVIFMLLFAVYVYLRNLFGFIHESIGSFIDHNSTVSRSHIRFSIAMLCGLAICSVILLVLNMKHPHLFVPRYLSSIALISVSIVAALISEFVFRRRTLYILLVLNGFLVYCITITSRAGDAGWDRAAALIEGQTRSCRSSKVYAAEFPAKYLVINQTEVINWAYRFVAHRFGFVVRVVDAESRFDSSDGQGCPTVLWIDHVNWSELPSALTADIVVKKLNIKMPSDFLAAATLIHTGSGVLVVSRPID